MDDRARGRYLLGVLLALDIYGQTIYMDTSTGVVIVMLASQPEAVNLEIYQDAWAAMAAISKAV